MNERGHEPSPEEQKFSAPDSDHEQIENKRPGKIGKRIGQLAKAGAVVAGVTLAGGVFSSAEGAQGSSESKHEQLEASWSTIINLVRTDMHRALDNGASKESVESYVQEAFAIMKAGKDQRKKPGAVLAEIDTLQSKTFKSPDASESFDSTVAKMDREFDAATKDMGDKFAAATKDMSEDLEIVKAEMDSTFEAMAGEFEAKASGVDQEKPGGVENQRERVEIPAIHPDSLPENFTFSPEWMQENVGKTFLQGDKVVVVADGESADLQFATDKAGLEADAMIANTSHRKVPKSQDRI